jgi:hypothetical protein
MLISIMYIEVVLCNFVENGQWDDYTDRDQWPVIVSVSSDTATHEGAQRREKRDILCLSTKLYSNIQKYSDVM